MKLIFLFLASGAFAVTDTALYQAASADFVAAYASTIASQTAILVLERAAVASLAPGIAFLLGLPSLTSEQSQTLVTLQAQEALAKSALLVQDTQLIMIHCETALVGLAATDGGFTAVNDAYSAACKFTPLSENFLDFR